MKKYGSDLFLKKTNEQKNIINELIYNVKPVLDQNEFRRGKLRFSLLYSSPKSVPIAGDISIHSLTCASVIVTMMMMMMMMTAMTIITVMMMTTIKMMMMTTTTMT